LILRLGSEIYYQPQIITGERVDGIMFAFATINFAHMAIFMFIFSVILCVSVSLATAEPDYKRISGLSFGTLTAEDKAISKGSYTTADIILSVILVVMVIFVLSYFTG
jgi:SSS family solute:Na+ symporter